MKKNKMMRVASALLVAVLMTTSVISGTFAKYVTTESASDSARVAKWGVFFDIEGGPLFNTQYATDDNTNYTNMGCSVESDINIVAPGTEGNLVKFRTTGTPEVSYKVTHTVDEENMETIFTKKILNFTHQTSVEVEDVTNAYYPIVFTLKYNNVDENDTAIYSGTDITELAKNIENCGYYFDVNENKYYVTTNGTNYGQAQDTAPEMTINWEWAFEVEDNATTSEVNEAEVTNKLDTTLGNLAAGNGVTDAGTAGKEGDYNLTVKLNITATAEQID